MSDSRNQRPSQRLVHTPLLGPMLEKDNAVRFDEYRLRRSREVILDRISALAAGAADQGLAGMRARRPSLWRYALAMGTAALIFSSAVASAYFVYRKVMSNQGAGEAPRRILAHPAARKGNTHREQPEIIDKGSGPAILDESAARPSRPRRPSAANKTAGLASRELSELDVQLGIFGLARRQAADGRHQEALVTLDELDDRYPKGALTIESRELRAASLYQMGSYADAARILEALTMASVSAGKKAQFFRLLGDAQSRQGQCASAMESYRRALGLGLEGNQAEAARVGIRRCALP